MIKRNTWIVLGVFAVLLAGAVIWDRLPASEQAEDEAVPTLAPPAPPLLDVSIDQIVSVSIREPGGEELLLRLDEGGNWQMLAPRPAGADELDILMIEQILMQIAGWRELTAMETVSELETVGLAYPAYRITLGLANGETAQVDIGDMTVTGTGYYVRVRGQFPQVVGAASVDGVLAALQAPPLLPTPAPVIEPKPTESP